MIETTFRPRKKRVIVPERCVPPECEGRHFARGWCRRHYSIMQKRKMIPARFCRNCGKVEVKGLARHCSEECRIAHKKASDIRGTRRWIERHPQQYREVTRKVSLKKNYGITIEQYEAMLNAQGGKCALCLDTCTTGRRLAVDHDRETGKVRGLLCWHCNSGIGKLKHDVEILGRAIVYLTQRTS